MVTSAMIQFLKIALMDSLTEKSNELETNRDEFCLFSLINFTIELDKFIENASPGPKFSNRHWKKLQLYDREVKSKFLNRHLRNEAFCRYFVTTILE